MHEVRFHLDFISPYAWLALLEAEEFGNMLEIDWKIEPVVYAGILNATGSIGPGEIEIKRNYTFDDVVRCAARLGHEFAGPPSHPFRSLEAVRTLWVFREDPKALRLARNISNACWGLGEDITNLGTLTKLVEQCDLDAANLEERITATGTKEGLMAGTTAAMERGVFGVPTFEFDGELFWGHDRLPHLASRIQGQVPAARKLSQAMIDRPGTAHRR
ncbi:MAG: 2-hydroxychromene-2-carboxylate isomerase [Planctomycetota bacterium]|nr:2-hydroxychromene-2-carboxylate isomerase [Planctomycetota bacterium]